MKRQNSFIFVCVVFISHLSAQSLPPGFGTQLVTSGINQAVAMAFTPDGRALITEQAGKLRVVKNDILLSEPFVDLDVQFENERGLLGVAVDPDFETNQYIYLYYTVPGDQPHNRVSRFTADGDVALAGSEIIILELENLNTAGIHNGGAMTFGPDGKLYVSVGDAAEYMASQNLDSYNGKILRINPDGSVPDGNPFATGSEQKKRIWAYGFRNPFTFAIHSETSQIFVNDVGQDSWEEVNDATISGKNFGWPMAEGMSANEDLVNPVYNYSHSAGCGIGGGIFFNPASTNYPSEYYGKYFLNDICSGWISVLENSEEHVSLGSFASGISWPIGLTLGMDGNIYFIRRGAGELHRIIYTETTAPYIVNHPVANNVALSSSINMAVSALGTLPLHYQWQKDGVDIEGATSSMYSVGSSTFDHTGDYRVIITNAEGKDTSNVATIKVLPNPPIAKILKPSSDTSYVAGVDIEFSGIGTDVEEGDLPESAFQWQINFHHNTHKHDQPPILATKKGYFHIANEGETSGNVWYRIILTVTDSDGLQGKDSLDVLPVTSTINLETVPEGLPLLMDGQPIATPATVVGVKGLLRTVGVVTPILHDGVSYEFESWRGGSTDPTFTTATHDTTFTAFFVNTVPVLTAQPADTNVYESQPLELEITALGKPPITYQWLKDGEVIEEFTTSAYSIDAVGLSDAGQYQVIVRNEAGGDTSNVAIVQVLPNATPEILLVQPVQNAKFNANSDIVVKGEAIDFEDGQLDPRTFRWKVHMHTENQFQEVVKEVTGLDSLVFLPQIEDQSAIDIFYKVYVSVTDSKGACRTDSLQIDPSIVKVSLNSNVPDIPISWNNIPFTTPVNIEAIEGTLHSVSAPAEMSNHQKSFSFQNWDGGGTDPHILSFAIPSEDSTLTAVYQLITGLDESTPRINIYPNPVKNYLTVQVNLNSQYQIFNAFGQLIVNLDSSRDNQIVDFTQQPSGMYLLKVIHRNNFEFFKIMKE